MNLWTTIGIASIISIIVSFLFDTLKARISLRDEKITIEKEHRYRSILLFMSVILDENNIRYIDTQLTRPTEDIVEYYIHEVELNLKYFQLFASKTVIKSIEKFLEDSNEFSFQIVATEMRKDLWGKKL